MKEFERSKNLLNSYIHANIKDMENRNCLKSYYNIEVEKVINQIKERGDYPYNKDVVNEFIKQYGEVEDEDLLDWLVFETQHYIWDKDKYKKFLEIDKKSIDEGFKHKNDCEDFKENKFYIVRNLYWGDKIGLNDKVCKYHYLKEQTPKHWFVFKGFRREGWHINNELYIKEA